MNHQNTPARASLIPSATVSTVVVLIALASAVASIALAAPQLPAALQALEKKGLSIVGTFPSPSGMTAYAAHAGTEPIALYLTPDGKHVIAGTLFDASGKNLTEAGLEKVLAQPMTEAVWGKLEKSHWIADGREDAPRTVYVFTDPNCPYCNKLWADARPWVDTGKVQLRHVMVGILTPTSAGKAAALLGEKNPAAALDAYERRHVASNAKTLASGRPKPLGDDSLKPLSVVPAGIADQLDANAALMASYGLRATPALVWKDAKGSVQMRQGAPESDLAAIFGPR
ncbi:MAG: thiol:disulfide interchange protein DsbG [Acidovorax sp. 17-64-282]|jgi:thiol:disulfide interchange protein DsbG|nr:thiol:disulfide interchange protein DsbG [Alphaproteobacteria bacterium]OYX11164.1 MAG: thiol:disulfide interchange protein DsbG [Acidovorax sp. 32-64-7]OYY25819.1 MAG: thiol:disulfide interchange protein DsbG [Acidovorax sp. 35-64-16]OYY84036.1 MAG: thiol:disulfide interchange protein DsbG [Acidovorax sp. 28-64-14]OYZ43194.1 MAG: thiol:disulfide interchange protein DsbG [Acidovorax sp. 16-64-162]OYZ67339.1 MAG: thiol:disulfide interchange protein DsbG [Acidovorax sp. 24-64-9]OZA56532.1 MA